MDDCMRRDLRSAAEFRNALARHRKLPVPPLVSLGVEIHLTDQMR
jgi:hypothetical protein